MVPPGIPGRSDTDFLPALRPGRRPGAPRRGGLSRRQGLPRDDVHDVRRRPYDAAVRRRDQAASSASTLGLEVQDGASSTRLAERSAPDLVDGLGRRLPGPERLPGHPPRRPGPRTTTAAGRRADFDKAIADALAATRPGGDAAPRSTRPRGSSATRRRSIPLSYDVGGRWRGRAARARRRTASGSSGWRGWRGDGR